MPTPSPWHGLCFLNRNLKNMDTKPAAPKATSFSHQAAKLSWVCPLMIFLISVVRRQIGSPTVMVICDLVALLLVLVGLIFGIVALFGISRHGKKGILIPAIVGIIINGLLLFIFVTNFMAARARAMQQQSGIKNSPMIALASAPDSAKQSAMTRV